MNDHPRPHDPEPSASSLVQPMGRRGWVKSMATLAGGTAKRSIHILLAVPLVATLPSCQSNETASSQAAANEALVPTVTIPAPPGSRGFGMPSGSQTTTDAPRPRRPSASVTDTEREIVTTTLDDLNMSDPYVYADDATQTYYLTSSGGSIYTSEDLKNWTGPYGAYDVTGTWMEGINSVAAAEIHHVNDKYYYAATFTDRDDLVDAVPRRYNVNRHQTMILVSDRPEGPYRPINPDPEFDLLPHSWTTIDGTIWNENGVSYFVFCHEWLQTIDGTMEYAELAPDLSRLVEEPTVIFRASEAPWALEMVGNGEMTYGLKIPGWVTDAPEPFRTQTGRLGMLWSSWGAHRYAQGVAYSESGSIEGPWVQEQEPLKGDNSGHGMMFTTFEGRRLLILHHAEGDGPRKPQLYEIDDSGDKLVLGARYNP